MLPETEQENAGISGANRELHKTKLRSPVHVFNYTCINKKVQPQLKI